MAHHSRARDRRFLEAEIRGRECRTLLTEFEALSENLRDWDEVWAHFDRCPVDDPTLQGVVRSIVERATSLGTQRCCNAILLRIFWPHLERVARRRARWDPDADELWQGLVYAFLETLCRLRPSVDTRSLGRKILNRTTHRLHDVYRVRWHQLDREVVTDPEILAEMAGEGADPELDRLRFELIQSKVARRLTGHERAGRITETDRLILTATIVYGVPLRRITDAHGLHYERTKKRLQRARARVLRADQFLVPDRSRKRPLLE